MKKTVSVLLVLALMLSAVLAVIPVSAASGEAIGDEWDFREMKPTGNYYLSNDISISADSKDVAFVKDFVGTLDGNGHKITLNGHKAVFWRVTGTVKNLTVDGNINLTSSSTAAGLTFYNQGILENITSKVAISGSGYEKQTNSVGGICAEIDGGAYPTIKDCVFEGSITFNTTSTVDAPFNMGGIVGKAASTSKALLDNCVNKGNITSNQYASQTGGIVGNFVGISIEITDCTNEGTISVSSVKSDSNGHMGLGGIVGCGQNAGNQDKKCTIKNCVNKGKITTADYSGKNVHCGGIIGRVYAMPHIFLENCQNSGDIITSNANGWSGTGGMIGNVMTVHPYVANANPNWSWSNISSATYTVRNCINSATISGLETGGIIGAGMQLAVEDIAIKIESCLNKGTVLGMGSTGGIMGLTTRHDGTANFGNITIKGCMNAGYVKGTNCSAGILGEQGGSSANAEIITLIDSCVNIGEIGSGYLGENLSQSYASGILATTARSTTIRNCVNTGKLVGPNINADNVAPITAPTTAVTITAEGNLCIDDYDKATVYATEKATVAEIASATSGDIPAIDDSALTEAFDSVKSLKGSDYTEKSWNTLVSACDYASSLYEDNVIVTQSQVATAALAINAAKTALKAYTPADNTQNDNTGNNTAGDDNTDNSDDNVVDQGSQETEATEPKASETVKGTEAEGKETKETKKEKKGGCASAVSGAAIALVSVIALGTGFVFKKKED